jgi:alkylation response protein AidB-like acyl-CoA dehydrogenase
MTDRSNETLERARGLGPQIAASADEIERQRRLPGTLVSALHDAGLFRMLLPRSLGGAELDPPTFVQVTEAIARVGHLPDIRVLDDRRLPAARRRP